MSKILGEILNKKIISKFSVMKIKGMRIMVFTKRQWELKVRQVLFLNLSMYYEKPKFRVLF